MNNKILLLGASGYIGKVFKEKLPEDNFVTMKHEDISVSNLLNETCKNRFDTIINCCGYVGRPNVDVVERHKEEAVYGNIIIPDILVQFANIVKEITILHISSGCIFRGDENQVFSETDSPNLDWNSQSSCSFYGGSKSMSEKIISRYPNHYICRLRMPFDHEENERNYLSKLLKYDKLLSLPNSLSHRYDFVDACIQLLEKECEFGTYNITNTGFITAKEICEIFRNEFDFKNDFKFYDDIEDFLISTGCYPRSNCVLSNDKLTKAGIKMRGIREAITESISNYPRG